ncbi:hypothetical protein GLGCALEP_03837 [Pseudomonas sp. MM221]|nr:hypothetical protein GLGCALEP_03837 [Pseudomonas sp. MM221]
MVQLRKWQPLLRLDGAQASYRQIVEGLVAAISEGRLRPGTPLPGTREMAQLLNVNRKTVILAYEEAETKGWLQSVQRRGTFVSQQLAAGRLTEPRHAFLRPGVARGTRRCLL